MYKDLNLNRDKLHNSIEKFLKVKDLVCKVSPLIHVNSTRYRVQISGNIETFIDFHFLAKGGTTIDLWSGGVNEFKTELADFIINDPEVYLGDSESHWFVARGIEEADFLGVIELLKESPYTKSICSQKDGSYQLTGKFDETLVIHYYKSKTVLLQGRQLLLYNEAVVYITELIELEELPKTFKENYKVNVNKADVETLYEHYFPISHSHHSSKFRKVVHQCIYNLQLVGDMYDYSFFVFPALRAIEGHLKIVLHANNIPLGPKGSFNMFSREQIGERYKLDQQYHKQFSANKIRKLEDAYNFYNNQRHSLFHWAEQGTPLDQTRLIENFGEARGLITDSFSIIDEYYAV